MGAGDKNLCTDSGREEGCGGKTERVDYVQRERVGAHFCLYVSEPSDTDMRLCPRSVLEPLKLFSSYIW